ncbi:solute carrier family 22 member 18 isoform X1 [Pipistrellus kuhlii]|uniref:solute carrier family 22 member 18 isoform X1 n=1 Tax=Pipistrellus kuhlii TaxID=59472 RepID=UPI001E273544|nr:solute carrier family 22 member 18 isoform X1 [Pipistrellus kuhlii]
MQGAGAPGGQGRAPSRPGALSRPRVLLLTYLLTTLDLTCLFMQFSVLPAGPGLRGLRLPADGLRRAPAAERAHVRQVCRPARGAGRPHRLLPGRLGTLPAPGGRLQPQPARHRPALCLPPARPAAAHAARWALTGGAESGQEGAAQMVVADLSAPAERPAALGRLGLCFGVGTILGSLLGGTLSATCGIQCPVLVALVANLLGAALSVTYIPASTKGARAGPPGGPAARVFDLRAVSRLLLQPGVLPVFLVKVASGFPSGLFMVMFSIICMDFFRLDSAQAGYLMSAFGVLLMVIQGLVIGRLSSRFSEAALVRASVLVLSLVGLAMALMSTVFHFCLLMPGLVFGLCLLNVVTDSMLTKAVSASDTGTMLGLCAAVQPLTRTLGPTLGGLLYRGFGVPAFGHVQLAVNLLVLLALCRQPTPRKADKVR